MLDDVASELFSALSQLSDHCVFSRKLIAYKIIKMWKYISGVSKVVEEKKKENALKATVISRKNMRSPSQEPGSFQRNGKLAGRG